MRTKGKGQTPSEEMNDEVNHDLPDDSEVNHDLPVPPVVDNKLPESPPSTVVERGSSAAGNTPPSAQ